MYLQSYIEYNVFRVIGPDNVENDNQNFRLFERKNFCEVHVQ